MAKNLILLVGTKKGAFLLKGDPARRDWMLSGPFCETWPINHVVADQRTGIIFAGGGNEWFGPAVWKSTDLGETWSHSNLGLAFPEGEDPISAVWSLAAWPHNGDGSATLYAGVCPAGLFRSDDAGETWSHLHGLRDHPSRPNWTPGGAGMILHHILGHPQDPDQIWIGISAVGVMHSADGGVTWEHRNAGTRNDYLPEGQRYPEYGQCVHAIAMAPGRPNRLYQQNHCGMYRSEDGGRAWQSIESGLPSTFGFPAVAHPRDPDTLFLLPLNGDVAGRFMPDAKAAIWRTQDAGTTWRDFRAGLPQEHAYLGVLRQAMAVDPLTPAGVYFGTSSGGLYASRDEGESWRCIAEHLPPILSVETLVLD